MADRYTEHSRASLAWFNKASDLHGAAAAVWYSIEPGRSAEIVGQMGFWPGYSMGAAVIPVFHMLCGMSIELALKAICVAKGDKPKVTHNLRQLATQAGVSFTTADLHLLDILAEAIIWYGKYPTPTRREDWDKLHGLAREHLFEKEPLGSIYVLHPNPALNWDGYRRLWCIAADVYWEARHEFE